MDLWTYREPFRWRVMCICCDWSTFVLRPDASTALPLVLFCPVVFRLLNRVCVILVIHRNESAVPNLECRRHGFHRFGFLHGFRNGFPFSLRNEDVANDETHQQKDEGQCQQNQENNDDED